MDEVFAPDATLYLAATGTYTGVETIAEYVLVSDTAFNGGYWSVDTFVLDPTSLDITGDSIQGQAFSNMTFYEGKPYELEVLDAYVNLNATFVPCGYQISYMEIYIDPKAGFWVIAGIPSDMDICLVVQEACVGHNTQFQDLADCLTYLQALPSQACAEAAFLGECKQCKWLHHLMATYNPDVHCVHVGPKGGPDPSGNYLCNNTQCASRFVEIA